MKNFLLLIFMFAMFRYECTTLSECEEELEIAKVTHVIRE